ncbi:acyl-CoA thioester hydrolase [Salibacterium salarium]|uniref:acyl-CoA thioesterase n=1 Tax=Salibacterium salarium TaxID=284579 RepID=UPI00277F4AF1|nr:thioesterase family protein [Salibacterium salarium]MDQ0298983.1 acyl-CoA thioester hydrolase [Salibacterium salarium]
MAHDWKVKVRASETDGLGHVSNISYFIYIEEARIELFRELTTMMDMKEWPFILASASCDYIQQAYFDDILHISTTVTHVGNSSFSLHHEISCERGIIAKGNSVVVHFNFDTQKSELLPNQWKDILHQHDTTKT